MGDVRGNGEGWGNSRRETTVGEGRKEMGDREARNQADYLYLLLVEPVANCRGCLVYL